MRDRRPLRDRRLQDQLARPARRGAGRLALPRRGAGGRDGALPLRAAGAALHGRAAPLPGLADPRLRPAREPGRRLLPVPARHDRRPRRRVRVASARRAGRGALGGAGRDRAPTSSTPAWRAARPRCCGRSTRRACCRPPTSTSRSRLAELAGEEDESVVLATALAVRGPRLGHVYVDLETVEATATVEGEEHEPVDLSALPWPDAGRLARAGRREPADRRSAAARRHRALPRPLLARGGADRLRPDRVQRGGGRRRRTAAGRAGPAVPRATPTPRSGSPPRPRCCGGSRWSPAGRAPARRPRWRGSWRC